MHEPLRASMHEQLATRDVSDASCTHVCAALIQTSLRGVDSHGINLFPHYCRVVDSGRITRSPNISVTRESEATAVVDGDHGFGHHVGAVAMQVCIEKAAKHGIGAAVASNSSHFAAAAYYGLMAADEGYIGLAMTNADSLVRAHGSRLAYFGTNPICVTAPLAAEEPLCLDMATSIVSFNKIKNFRARGEPIDPAWACNAEGTPTTDAATVATLNAIGGYKGFGLGMIVEMFCGVLANGPYAHQIIPMYQQLTARRSISHFFLALDPERFLPGGSFRQRLQDMVDHVRGLPALLSDVPVKVPGDPEKESYKNRSLEGIPIEDHVFDEFIGLSSAFRGAAR